MRSKSNKIQFIALAFIMLFSVMNVWGIDVIQKETTVTYDKFQKEYWTNQSMSQGAPCDFDKTNGYYHWDTDDKGAIYLTSTDLVWSSKDLSVYDFIIVQADIEYGEAQITIDYEFQGNSRVISHYVNKSGVFKIPLHDELWFDDWAGPVTVDKNVRFKDVKRIRFGGYSKTGTVRLKNIVLAKSVRSNIDWDENGHIVLGYQDILGDTYWTHRNGDYIEKTDNVRANNYGHWATFKVEFSEQLEFKSFTPEGMIYPGASVQDPNNKDNTFNLISSFVVYDIPGTQYKGNSLNSNYTSNTGSMTGLGMQLRGTGSMHLYSVVIRHKDVKTVSFNSDGGSYCTPMDYYHTALNLPTPTKEGYTFAGWYKSTTFTNANKIGTPYAPTEDITLVARWTKGGSFDVAQNRIYHLDFEGMSDADLLSSANAPTEGLTGVTEEAYYNYGGKGRILKDSNPNFNMYYQNLAVGTNEFTKSVADNFLRVVLTDDQKNKFNNVVFYSDNNGNPNYSHPKPTDERAVTIGFWVNAKLANKYELPLERGSMFCMFSNERFQKADDDIQPRYMFDIACNGWTYSYMPNSYYVTKKDNKGNDIKDENGNVQQELVEYTNKFFYGEKVDVVTTGTPKVSLFGADNYAHTQDQRQRKFYDDNEWHYITYVATNDLKYVTMYVDGVKTGEKDMTTLGTDLCKFEEKGDYGGRVFYLRNLVLGGFTPHGLFFNGPKSGGQYYSDAALAYDDISIYSVALSEGQIREIIAAKNVEKENWPFASTPTEWHFTEALKSYAVEGGALSSSDWTSQGNGIYKLNKNISASELKSGGKTLLSTEHLTFTAGTGDDIYVDTKNGLIGLTRSTRIYIPRVPNTYNVYFVAKPNDAVNYPLDHYDLYPVGADVGDFFTRGVSLYGGDGKDDFSVLDAYKHTNLAGSCGFYAYQKGKYDTSKNKNILWISDVIVSPYCVMYTYDKGHLFSTADRTSVHHVDVTVGSDGTMSSYTLPQLLLTKYGGNAEALSNYAKGNANGNPYIRFSSSAPRVAHVDQSGNVTLTGLAGYATIKAELIFGNLHDNCISTAYEIRVKKESATKQVVNSSNIYGVGQQFTVKKSTSSPDGMTMTMGGWTYADKYQGTDGDSQMDTDKKISDSWSAGFGFLDVNNIETIDGFSTASQGGQNAKSESYTMNGDDGQFYRANVPNETPWTLPCRGSYLKFEPEKAGVLTVYVLQNGNLYKASDSHNYSSHVAWRPVYIADETGKVIDFVKYSTNSKISENDNFFKEGRRRAQFIEGVADTYNKYLKADLIAMRDGDTEQKRRFHLLIDNWSNAGWKQKVIPTGDGGYMVMSKGIVRYSFNVYPGKTYYVFSNDTKIGYSGYNFEEGKLLNENDDQYETNPVKPASIQTTTQVYNDVLGTPTFPTGKDCVPVTYNRTFTPGKWGSICLPFSMNNKQMKENFGDETAVVLLKEIDSEGVVQMVWHVNQDIIAGYPYFILPRGKVKGADVTSITQINTNAYFDPDVKAPSFMVGPKMKNSQSATVSSVDELGYTTSYPYVFTGNFATETATAGSYVMLTSGVLTKVSNTPSIKPFRAYLRYCEKLDPTKNTTDPLIDGVAEVKPLNGMGYKNLEGEETTTSIEQILEANGIFIDSANVYGVDGQVKRYNTHDLNGLPKGIYIVNGKKYVVK